MSTSRSNVYLWVKPEPFDIGILPTPPPSKLTHHNLRKLFAYAKNKGKAGYPYLSYAVWKHVACNKLQIEEKLAWVYFHTCIVITDTDTNNHLKFAEQLSSIKSEEDKDNLKDKQKVDLLQFILYLYVQHAHVISLKSPIVTGDEYPTRSRSSDLGGRAAIGIKGIDEHEQMSFIISNITDILDLLVEPESYGEENDVMLTVEAVKKLSFLIGATTNGRSVLSLDVAARQQKEAQKAGYSKISQMFSCRRLQSWIKAYLRQNPFGICSCLSLGQKLRGRGYSCGDESLNSSLHNMSVTEESLMTNPRRMEWSDVQQQLMQDIDLTASYKSSQPYLVNRILTNVHFAPDCCKRIICNQVCRRTVARSGELLNNSIVNIHRCQHSHLYLISPLHSVVIEKCHDSTIVLGAVETVVMVIACENIRLVGVTKRIVVVNDASSKTKPNATQNFALSEPVLIGRNLNLKFAPYYTYYPRLDSDMIQVGIAPEPNAWNKCIVLGTTKGEYELKNVWIEYPPEDFFRFVIPFDMEGETKTCTMHLPKHYEEALLIRERRVEEWHQMIRDSSLHKPQRTQLQSLVNERFQDWLKETGYCTLLESLAPAIPPTAPK